MTQDITLVIDSGTTNSKVWIAKNSTIMGKSYIHVGAQDVAMAGNVNKLKEGLKRAVSEALRKTNTKLKEIKMAVACGMITSDLGLINMPHLTTPVNMKQLVKNAKLAKIPDFLPFPILFIRGIKNNVKNLTVDNLEKSDFMRGEETQVFGLMDLLDLSGPVTFVTLSSHTKAISINRQKEITGSITTLSGQTYSAIKDHTVLATSLPRESNLPIGEKINKKAIITGYKCAIRVGFLRSLLMVRLADVLMDTSAQERRYFLEGMIAGSDIYAIKHSLSIDLSDQIVLIGNKARCKIYRYLLVQDPQVTRKILIEDEQMAEKATVVGATKIAKMWILDSSK